MGMQEQLFHEDFRDALKHLVKALGGVEAVGVELWPSKTRKAAGNWLSDCLNPERPAKLDIEEIVQLLAMGRDRGIHCAVWQLADEIGYTRPEIAPAKSQYEVLAEQFARKSAELSHLAQSLGQLERLRAVK